MEREIEEGRDARERRRSSGRTYYHILRTSIKDRPSTRHLGRFATRTWIAMTYASFAGEKEHASFGGGGVNMRATTTLINLSVFSI